MVLLPARPRDFNEGMAALIDPPQTGERFAQEKLFSAICSKDDDHEDEAAMKAINLQNSAA